MLYSAIDIDKAKQYKIELSHHLVLEDKGKVIVNENELRLVDDDINKAASILGGEVLTNGQIINFIKANK